ncbi:hypothetical protein GQ597_04875 [Gilliamella sp. Pra-s65]|uniref:hypothetical protein n=1 Tax=unclassified Gilliamella TaxID=2685620 RepID=UPI0013654745|nr:MULTISPECIES: hypothetical protein [unclassified Gilliamella]MWN90039.1 hypothetical protein [Gilliamella sp. Pra-s65]MWP72835.1 hypothetical protein [Gilliamella sp. Pra-s52]
MINVVAIAMLVIINQFGGIAITVFKAIDATLTILNTIDNAICANVNSFVATAMPFNTLLKMVSLVDSALTSFCIRLGGLLK